MKVVINRCYGGFSLSKAAVLWLAARGHEGAKKELAEREEADRKWGSDEYPPYPSENYLEKSFAYNWRHPGSRLGYGWDPYGEEDGLPRHHPLLIECVETLGGEHREGASGPCAELKIVEIPDGVEYCIVNEYDGMEHVAERHRTWS